MTFDQLKKPFTIYRGLPKGIYALFAARIIDNIGNFIMPLITLIITQKIGFTEYQAGICATIFVFSQAPFLIWGGKLIDKYGSKKIIVIFNILGASSYLLCCFLKPDIFMALFIALASNLFAVAAPAFNALISQITTEQTYKKSYSLVYLGYNLGYAIGPALAGILFNRHLHLLFFIDAATALASVVLIFIFVDDSKTAQYVLPAKSDAVNTFEPDFNGSVKEFLLHSPVLLLFSAAFLVYNFSYIQWSFLLPLQITSIFKSDGARIYSLLVTVNALTVILLTPATTAVTHRFRSLNLITAGGFFYVISFLIFGISKFLILFLISVVVLTIGQILVNLNSAIFVTQKTPNEYLGRANSILSIINGAGYAIGPAIMGYMLTSITYGMSWIVIAILMFLSAVGMLFLSRYDKKTSS